MKTKFLILHLLGLFFFISLTAQKLDNEQLRQLVVKYKADIRGPYKDIRWFCPDGSVIPPKEKCPEPGGVQRARYKDEVAALGKEHRLFLGQILSTTDKADFWDADHYHSRLKQYQVEKYLRAVDNGWILRRGQFYRGAIQAEDEESWGIDFFNWLLEDTLAIERQFYLIREAAKDIPHRGDDNRMQKIRAVSMTISDAYAPFMDLRVKIHGQPEAADIQKVKDFRQRHQSKLTAELNRQFEQLLADMQIAYQPVALKSLQKYIKRLPKDAEITRAFTELVTLYGDTAPGRDKSAAVSEILWKIREALPEVESAGARLALIDISNELEGILIKENSNWPTPTLADLLDKICHLSLAAAGSGVIETWEWSVLSGPLSKPGSTALQMPELNQIMERSRSLVEWGAAMTRAVYKDVVELYSGFEPLAYGFFDDRVRSSVLLPLGQDVSKLGDFIAREANLSNQLLDIPNQSHARGLNPGFAMGELVVIDQAGEDLDVSREKIYVFSHPPSDLKPVAGIATVSEGNLVSHVQLLARNLGIPNAVISNQNLESLRAYAGRKIFYAVSNKGTVLMKPAEEMTAEERELFAQKTRNEEKIRVPVERIDLQQKQVINMRKVNATASGKLCGPKAANLGQLKELFPDNVVEGLVIPFGIFREHMNQPMPGQDVAYWTFLNETFQQARHKESAGQTEAEVENYTLGRLETLRAAIKELQLSDDFVADLEAKFREAFDHDLGQTPVFLRSDTNMEDLKDFTGAGLNLTLFNVVDRAKILQGVKDVWASPYTERSFKWRQRYLLNPESVFPSILIIPSVDVDYSGVMITKGISTDDARDLTVAFSRGAGGAVDGQAAESYLLTHDGVNQLLSPAREPFYNRLPESGGTKRMSTAFNQPILNAANVTALRAFADLVREKLPGTPGIESDGPFDIELGFRDNKLWLFQVRPFVENKNARASAYLQSIAPDIPEKKSINLNRNI